VALVRLVWFTCVVLRDEQFDIEKEYEGGPWYIDRESGISVRIRECFSIQRPLGNEIVLIYDAVPADRLLDSLEKFEGQKSNGLSFNVNSLIFDTIGPVTPPAIPD
jgi:hypothetical protein